MAMAFLLTRRQLLGAFGVSLAAPALAQPEPDLEVPYVPTPEPLVEKMLDLADLTPADYLIDLGCGDGRIPVAAGRRGARALGVDLDPLRLNQALAAARRADLQGRVSFRNQNLFRTPIHEATVVALYLLPAINLRLRPRLLTELAPGARVVSHAFDMGDWEPDAREEHDHRRIFLWHVPAVAGGSWEVNGADGSYRLLELEQSFQRVTGTLSGAGTTLAVTGTLRGPAFTLSGADGATVLDGRIDGAEMMPSIGSAWRGVRTS
jgi:SAM-dependent methyltransferase